VGGVSTFLAQLPENNNKIAPSPKVTYVLPHVCKFMHILIHLEDIFKAIFLAIMLLHPKPDVASEEISSVSEHILVTITDTTKRHCI
jgi:hypothetical protein